MHKPSKSLTENKPTTTTTTTEQIGIDYFIITQTTKFDFSQITELPQSDTPTKRKSNK